jgi:hypothetical protein
MEQSHQDSDRIAALYESYKNTERDLLQHRSRELPLPSDVNGQPPEYQSLRTPAGTAAQRNQPQQLPHEQELPPTYQEALYQKNLKILLDSARKGNTQEAVQQMKYFKQIHQKEIVGTKPLREALIGGRLETFKYLAPFYNSQEQLVLATLCKTTADLLLTTALLTKDLAAIKNYLILSGDTPTVKHINQVIDFDGENIELLKLLIEHKAPVNVVLQKGPYSVSNGPGRSDSKTFSSYIESPLCWAVAHKKTQTIVYLLQAGANPRRCYNGKVYCYKEDARIDLLAENVSTSPAIKQLIRDNQKHRYFLHR